MSTGNKNQTLGEYIRDRRLSRGWSLNHAAEASKLHFSYWSKLENGVYDAPAPKHLQVIARALQVDFEDLYALAGYELPQRLPSFRPYLRAKYALPPEAIADLERYFELLRNHFDIPKDQPVFPPKSSKQVKPKSGDQRRRAA
jgi:transcriptional regulator with XRE-family HTH domain